MSTEPIAVDAEEIPIEQAVEKSFLSQLEKAEITKQLLTEKRDECLKLQLNGQDKEAYTLIRETRLNQKATRVAIEKICKKGREDATKTQKAWIAVEKEWVKIVSEGEDYLSKLEEDFENEAERIKQETKRKQEEQFILRQSELTKMGAAYQDGNFVLNDVSFEAVLIKESDDDVWETMKEKFHSQYLINEEARLAEEKKKQEAEAELQRQREEQDRKQKELEEREAAIKAKEQEEIDRQKKIEEERVAEENRRKEEVINNRINQLSAIGMTYDRSILSYVFQDFFIKHSDVENLDDAAWDALVTETGPMIEEKKRVIEEQRLADIEEQKKKAAEEAVKKEQERAAEAARQAEVKRKQEEERKAKEMEMADDKTKWNNWLESVKQLPAVPAMKSPAYRTKAAIAREKIEEITGI